MAAPEQQPQALDDAMIRAIVARHLPGRRVVAFRDRGVWIRHVVEIMLDGDETVYLKIRADDQGTDPCEKEAYVAELLRANGLPAPRTLALDLSCEVLPAPFIIQARLGGRPLSDLLRECPPGEVLAIRRTLGAFYRRLHSIRGTASGWIYGAGQQLPFSPNDFMCREVIGTNAGELVRRGLLPEGTWQRLIRVSEQALPYLKDHDPVLVFGALPWTIYLDRDDAPGGTGWRVTKLTDLHDLLYWDRAFDLAAIKYPTFGRPDAAGWAAFLSEYGAEPDERRLLLYGLIQRVDAALGQYFAPASLSGTDWRSICLTDMESSLARLEGELA